MEPDSLSEVMQVAQRLFPDPKRRTLCLSLFAEAISNAHECGPDKWTVHLKRNRFRLIAGSLIIFTVEPRTIWVALDRQQLEESVEHQLLLEQTNSWRWDNSDYPEYTRVPSQNGYYVPDSDHLQMWPIVRKLHFTFVMRVAEKFQWLNVRSQSGYTPAVLELLRRELNQPIPEPGIVRPSSEIDFPLPEEISDGEFLYEGARKRISVNAYERSPLARRVCLEWYGTRCAACEQELSEIYGTVADGLIHVHHLKALSDVGSGYEVDPVADLRPVCPNCHAVIHRRSPPYTIEEVKRFLDQARQD